jgi:hypothetical protein
VARDSQVRDPPARNQTTKGGHAPPLKIRNKKAITLPTRPPRPNTVESSHSPASSTTEQTTTSSSRTSHHGLAISPSKREFLNIHRRDPWDKTSFLNVVLHYSFNLSEQFLEEILQQVLAIASTERFLNFFNDRPREFLRKSLAITRHYMFVI